VRNFAARALDPLDCFSSVKFNPAFTDPDSPCITDLCAGFWFSSANCLSMCYWIVRMTVPAVPDSLWQRSRVYNRNVRHLFAACARLVSEIKIVVEGRGRRAW
jgi:hypothetical protein